MLTFTHARVYSCLVSLSYRLLEWLVPTVGNVGHVDYVFYMYCQYGVSQVALVIKNPPANTRDIRDVGSIPGSGRSPRGGHGNPLQYSCLENLKNRGAWWATVHGIAKSRMRPSKHADYNRQPKAVSPSHFSKTKYNFISHCSKLDIQVDIGCRCAKCFLLLILKIPICIHIWIFF